MRINVWFLNQFVYLYVIGIWRVFILKPFSWGRILLSTPELNSLTHSWSLCSLNTTLHSKNTKQLQFLSDFNKYRGISKYLSKKLSAIFRIRTAIRGGDFWTTLWDKIFKLVEIFVVASLEWENVISFNWFGYFTPWTWVLSFFHVVLYEYLRVFLNTPFKNSTL